uniref:Uncharacterized protein n=1 Tax=Chromera velia CCMP2878 TaxID=1169474 RepID=A0A0G4G192_9ALVE|eukprot:Cvel_19758.t1-p1 / transcript=Cvel_19758.t1 / gene=Cvel_19758 / organism=Chromera_velia_CCMP2878 / gene_product=hypothetical protein / transcript_product=hypothetical protein / location=Cvel_scaffold1730:26549-27031(-) / protein_length=161 / sequence_SO=supercontig / SO=protein_coding / is_pseudo=false
MPYMDFHHRDCAPKLFTLSEVSDLNAGRAPDDQLSLDVCGLLTNHCCYEACPFFLKDLRTDAEKREKAKQDKKRLFYHFEWDRLFFRNFIPSYHAVAVRILKDRSPTSLEDFSRLVDNQFNELKAAKGRANAHGWWVKSDPHIREITVKSLWEQKDLFKGR